MSLHQVKRLGIEGSYLHGDDNYTTEEFYFGAKDDKYTENLSQTFHAVFKH